MQEGRTAVQRNYSRLEKWTDGNLTMFSIGGYKIIHPRGDSPVHYYRTEVNWLWSSSAEEPLGVLVELSERVPLQQ